MILNSESVTKIIPALVKAQGAFKPAVKDSVNPQFSKGAQPKPSYVSLAQAIESVSAALLANGIVLLQQTDIEDARTVLITRLVHESGEWIASRYPVHPVKADPQGEGSALTYARRYALMALVGIAPEDDDGNSATKAANEAAAKEAATVQDFCDAIDQSDALELERIAAEIAASDLSSAAKAKLRTRFSAHKHALTARAA